MGIIKGLWGLCGLFLLACGDTSSSSASCDNVDGCGGDVVGTWKVTSSCLSVDTSDMMSDSCPGLKTTASGYDVTGTATFNADMTFATSLTMTGNVVVTMPKACLTRQGITVTCAQVQQSFEAQIAQPDALFSSGSCKSASDGGCSCTLAITPRSSTSAGTYSTENGVLTQMHDSGTLGESEYCVKGGKLTISPHEGSAMGDSNVTGSIVFGK